MSYLKGHNTENTVQLCQYERTQLRTFIAHGSYTLCQALHSDAVAVRSPATGMLKICDQAIYFCISTLWPCGAGSFLQHKSTQHTLSVSVCMCILVSVCVSVGVNGCVPNLTNQAVEAANLNVVAETFTQHFLASVFLTF